MNLLELSQDEIKIRLTEGDITVAVIGLGYIGLSLSCGLTSKGIKVIGTDLDQKLVNNLNNGKVNIYEPGVEEELKDALSKKLFFAMADTVEAVKNSDIIMITVGTPIDEEKIPILGYIEKACEDIGLGLAKSDERGKIIILRSTVVPNTTENFVKPLLEKISGLKAGKDFGLAFCPERTVEGKALKEFETLPKIIGGIDKRSTELAAAIFSIFGTKIIQVSSPRVAETAKIFDNVYRDVNIALANELALICEKIGVDIIETIGACNSGPRTRILIPGAGVGGSCLPKDPYILSYLANQKNFSPEIILASRERNELMPSHVIELVLDAYREMSKQIADSKILVLGLAFKSNTDDVRETVAAPIIKKLQELGADVFAHDPYVSKEKAKGIINTNKISLDIYETVHGADCLLVITDHLEYQKLNLRKIKDLMTLPGAIVDGRHVFDPIKVLELNIVFRGVGRPSEFFYNIYEN